MSKSRDHLVNWLKDAHAMEAQAVQALKGMEGRLEHYPELKEKLRANEAIAHANQADLEFCLESLGTNPSALKDMGAKAMGTAQGISGIPFPDEVMKAALSLHSVHHLAIGSYKILTAAARACGEAQVIARCEGILKREEDIARWLDGYLPRLTESFLALSESGSGGAKR